MTQNQIAFARLKEDIRHNRASERLGVDSLFESAQHNRASESVNWYSAESARRQVGVSAQMAAAQAKQAETSARLADYQGILLPSNVSLNEARASQSLSQAHYSDVQADWHPVSVASKSTVPGAVAGGIYGLFDTMGWPSVKDVLTNRDVGGSAYGSESYGVYGGDRQK